MFAFITKLFESIVVTVVLEYSTVLTAGNERVSLNLAGNDTVFNVRFEAFGAVRKETV